MTRNLVIATGLFLAAFVGLLIMGLAGNTPFLLMGSLLCAGPLFMLCLGAALGRASNEFSISRKTPARAQPVGRAINPRIQREEPLS